MQKEIVVKASKEQTQIALLEDRELVELYVETPDTIRTIGNIYLGRIRKIMPNIQACFVDIGQKQDAFLHFSDLSETLPDLLRYLGEKVEDPTKSNIVVKPESITPSFGEMFDLGDEDEEEDDLEISSVQDGLEGESGRRKRDRRRKKKKKPDQNSATSEDEDDAPEKPRATQSAKPPREPREGTPAKQPRTQHPKREAAATPEDDTQPKRSRAPRKPSEPRPPKTAPSESAPDALTASETETPTLESGEETPRPPRKRRSRSKSNKTAPENLAPEDMTSQDVAALLSALSDQPAVADDAAFSGDAEGAPKRKRRNNRRKKSPRSPEEGGDAAGETDAPEPSIAFAATAQPAAGAPEKPFRDATFVHPARYLREGQRILVKIIKEPISNKGSRVTTDISLAGRFLVLIPRANYVAVSKKIASQKERKRLRVLASSLLPEGFGLIVRTVAEDRDAKTLYTDLKLLLDKWARIEENIKKRANPPAVIYQDVSMVSSVIRDLFTEDYDRILIDDPKAHRNIKSYVQAVAPHMAQAVQLYTGIDPIFKGVNIEAQLAEAFTPRVNMPSGGYLFVEHTEAMHVVDVNSGRAGHGMTQEENSVAVNLEAVRYIAKHLRLRDLGGIIVVDFIDLRLDSNRRKVLQALRREFKKDRAVTKVLPMSDFGLVEITRQRLRPSYTSTSIKQPAPNQVPLNPSVAELMQRIEAWMTVYKASTGKQDFVLRVHPFLAAYLKNGLLMTQIMRWRFQQKNKVRVIADEKVDPVRFRFDDPATGENITEQFRYY